MEDREARQVPLHLWVIGSLSMIWSAFGAYDYVMTQLRDMDYLAFVSDRPEDIEAMLAYLDSFPIWAEFGWALGVWGAVLGSVYLLLRKGWAVLAFGLSLAGAVASLGYQILDPDLPAFMKEGAMAFMPYGVIAIAVALFLYARAMQKAGVLRGTTYVGFSN